MYVRMCTNSHTIPTYVRTYVCTYIYLYVRTYICTFDHASLVLCSIVLGQNVGDCSTRDGVCQVGTSACCVQCLHKTAQLSYCGSACVQGHISS